MSRKTTTLASDYFEDRYLAAIDPWNFRSSEYERNKYAATIAALGKPRYRSAIEIGCSIGVLTGLLASRSQEITAIDTSATAIAAARQNGIANAVFVTGSVPRDFPAGRFDLIVLSEVLYYFDASDLARVAECCGGALSSDGEILLCHWLGETDYPLTGEAASELFARHIVRQLPVRTIVRDDIYRLERFSRRGEPA
jgi:SAM-dependent methyltransferase